MGRAETGELDKQVGPWRQEGEGDGDRDRDRDGEGRREKGEGRREKGRREKGGRGKGEGEEGREEGRREGGEGGGGKGRCRGRRRGGQKNGGKRGEGKKGRGSWEHEEIQGELIYWPAGQGGRGRGVRGAVLRVRSSWRRKTRPSRGGRSWQPARGMANLGGRLAPRMRSGKNVFVRKEREWMDRWWGHD